jgi:hypothetical protein
VRSLPEPAPALAAPARGAFRTLASHPADRRSRVALVLLPLATGAALVAYIALGVPLLGAGVALAAAGAGGWALLWPSLSLEQRSWIRARVGIGLRAGAVGIVAYDAVRFGVVAVADLSFEPFHIFPRFGYALFGPGVSELSATIAGAAFHVANGLGFAVAFVLLAARPTPLRGIAWAMLLEAAMLGLYPGWLGVSLTGQWRRRGCPGAGPERYRTQRGRTRPNGPRRRALRAGVQDV